MDYVLVEDPFTLLLIDVYISIFMFTLNLLYIYLCCIFGVMVTTMMAMVITLNRQFLPLHAIAMERYCRRMTSVCPSVRLSVCDVGER